MNCPLKRCNGCIPYNGTQDAGVGPGMLADQDIAVYHSEADSLDEYFGGAHKSDKGGLEGLGAR